ncbi:hypothetical protein SAMN05421541_13534 [Actinoplanes philippinensis]|uniref:Uncharacterized protein n=1 Tax=Actinoplanes philippinensis TaxID=35752 RepID=A0A1I2N462_9ACTN|nr:hypothetical protein [Actinoplanes philippinensis]SFF96181.1 hypothetical protein SAMN05421541_13534 [Actinoplanes philippinensis]
MNRSPRSRFYARRRAVALARADRAFAAVTTEVTVPPQETVRIGCTT